MAGYEHRKENEADEHGVGEPIGGLDASRVRPGERAGGRHDRRRGDEFHRHGAEPCNADGKNPGLTGVWGK